MITSALKLLLPWQTRALIRKIRYFGRKYRCSVCDSRIRQLRPSGHKIPVLEELGVVGAGYKAEDECPVCLSNSRTRLVVHYLIKEAEIELPHLRLLHVAPEFGISLIMYKLCNIDYFPADLFPNRYTNAKTVQKMNITNIGQGSNAFDAIICNHVLEHIENDRLAMAELFRVLAPRGWAILQVPVSGKLNQTFEDPTITDPAERERHFGQWDHVRIYAMDYVTRLSDAGFSVEVFDPAARWGRETVEALRLDPREMIFVARKDKNGAVGVRVEH